jgi:hypothetical protein
MARKPPPEATRFKKGQSGNPNGRPRKWVSSSPVDGYKKSEIETCYQNLLAFTETELKSVMTDARSTALEKAVAKTLQKAISYGDIWKIEQILTRRYGAPTQKIEEDLNINVKWEDPE